MVERTLLLELHMSKPYTIENGETARQQGTSVHNISIFQASCYSQLQLLLTFLITLFQKVDEDTVKGSA